MGAFLLVDPFQGMPIGSGIPAGWTADFDFGSACFGFNQAPGGIYPFTGPGAANQYHWFRDRAATLKSPDMTGNSAPSFAVFFAFRIPGYQGPHNILQINSLTLPEPLFPSGQDVALMQLTFENDMTFSWLGAAGVVSNDVHDPFSVVQFPQQIGKPLLDNSGLGGINGRVDPYHFEYDTWYYAWLSVTFAQRNDLPGNPVTISGTLVVNGESVLTVMATPIAIGGDSFPSMGPYISELIFLNPGTLDLSIVYVQVPPVLDWPAPFPRRQIRESQTIVEVAELPRTSLVRDSQEVIELAKLPSNSHVRISQMVIELPPGGSRPSGGWQVKEA